ncbi:hypothetical protein PG5_02620 [Pseudomonas sp. G5(2012)]|nr:hypothetical protein PG5_02620 [Pseudomonas sp. G5(2012)]
MQMTGQVECKWVGKSVQLPNGEVYGWKNCLRDAVHERPGPMPLMMPATSSLPRGR